eukprot:XP_001697925.1 predicted protein [Chlamydomonas reinhardtii]
MPAGTPALPVALLAFGRMGTSVSFRPYGLQRDKVVWLEEECGYGRLEGLPAGAAAAAAQQDDGEPWLAAARNSDFATLRALLRLRCPWGPPAAPGVTFARAIEEGDDDDEHDEGLRVGCELRVLRWLVAEGCPVEWACAGVCGSA